MSDVKDGRKYMRQFQDQDYVHQLSKEDKEFVKKFNSEFYNHTFGKDPLHEVTEELKTETFNREYVARNDVWNLSDVEYMATIPDAILSDVSTETLDWEDVYKREGFERASEVITDQTLDDLENNNIDKKVVLYRFHSKMGKLRKLHDADRRQNGKEKDETNADEEN